jgi:GDP-4-dehydro-6-deoxy-D-mannose reductase
MASSIVRNSRLLITGDGGFVGQHASNHWPLARGLSSFRSNPDICDKAGLLDCLLQFKPEYVLHLAALSFVPDSFRAPERTFEVNFLGTLRLLEALSESGFNGRLLFIGTGDAYGRVEEDDLPIRESLPLRPRNPYAVSKVAAEALCYQWSQTSPFEIIMARPFNHIGAGQTPNFAISDFARQIAQIASGERSPILSVGNIEVTRDFIDVNDVIDGYELLLDCGKNGEVYNLCSGTERSLRSMIGLLLQLSGVKASIETDPQRFRPADQSRVFGSHEKITRHTGWKPTTPIEETLLNLYRYWEHVIGK